jgi:hypothetical protein
MSFFGCSNLSKKSCFVKWDFLSMNMNKHII